MFLHIGADVSVRSKDVVAIIDIKSAELAEATREFLQVMDSESTLLDISQNNPRSFVVTREKVYLSPISAVTLAGRASVHV